MLFRSTPLLEGYEDHKELPYASTLCAACTEACPVKIPLHEHLIRHRQIIVEKNMAPTAEKLMMKGFAAWGSNPSIYNMSAKMAKPALGPWTKDGMIENGPGPLKAWTDVRDFYAPQGQSFRSWFKQRQKDGESK